MHVLGSCSRHVQKPHPLSVWRAGGTCEGISSQLGRKNTSARSTLLLVFNKDVLMCQSWHWLKSAIWILKLSSLMYVNIEKLFSMICHFWLHSQLIQPNVECM